MLLSELIAQLTELSESVGDIQVVADLRIEATIRSLSTMTAEDLTEELWGLGQLSLRTRNVLIRACQSEYAQKREWHDGCFEETGEYEAGPLFEKSATFLVKFSASPLVRQIRGFGKAAFNELQESLRIIPKRATDEQLKSVVDLI